MVDALLASPAFADRWTNKWADLLDCNSKFLGDKGVRKFRNWIHSAVAENMPYDKFVRAMITATGDAYENAPANYLRVVRDTSTATENVTQLFLGVRFSCNKCHDHPFERWTQNQYYQFGAFFSQVSFKPGTQPGDEVVYDKAGGEVMHPKTAMAVAPLVPVGHLAHTADFKTGTERRDAFADWLTSKDNPFFSRAMVNRLWSYFLGKGIIDPGGRHSRQSNPPSNPELLEALNKDFVNSGFDLKHMMRQIVLSRTYQASIQSNKWNADDKTNFSHALPRRLEAEQLYDAIHHRNGHGRAIRRPAGWNVRAGLARRQICGGRWLSGPVRQARPRNALRVRAFQHGQSGPGAQSHQRPDHFRRHCRPDRPPGAVDEAQSVRPETD